MQFKVLLFKKAKVMQMCLFLYNALTFPKKKILKPFSIFFSIIKTCFN